jgi:GNAT acetyltransferase
LLFTPATQLEALFVLNDAGCIVSTREPSPNPGPRFYLIRGSAHCAWAVHADVPKDLAVKLDDLAREEPAISDFHSDPLHARQYVSLLGGKVWSGPVFTFPQVVGAPPREIVTVDRIDHLTRHFTGWTADELPERAPIVAVVEDGYAVSVCFCARRSAQAAEAGLETAECFRGRGLGPRVTVAWVVAIRASGRLPMYSTSWSNKSSLAVARKLGLNACASDWSLSE